MPKRKPIEFLTKSGKRIGVLRCGVLYKVLRESRHLFRKVGKTGAWGIDYETLHKKLPQKGSVYITDTEARKLYMVSNAVWRENGVVLHFKEGTVDHYTQSYLPREFFSVVNQKPYGN